MLIFQPYPQHIRDNLKSIANAINTVSRIRTLDIANFNAVPGLYLSGRLVQKVPAASTDITALDRIGDVSFATDGTYIYYCVYDSGMAAWRRVALETW